MMSDNAKPIKPEEVTKFKATFFPNYVLESFNELIAEKFSGRSATFNQVDVIKRMISKGQNLTEEEIFVKGWLNVEEIYREAGWEVGYDKPGWGETYESTFTFKKK